MLKKSLNYLLLIILLVGCTTGQNALKKGDYYAASLQAISRLRSNPDSKNAQATISKSYPLAIQYFQKKIDDALMTNIPFKYSASLENYQKMDFLADEILRCPAALEIVGTVTSYTEQLAHVTPLAAKEQYQAGLKALNKNTMIDARKAYTFFEQALKLHPGLPDAERKKREAENKGTLKVVIDQNPVYSEYYKLSAQAFYIEVISYLRKHVEKRFLAFYTPEDAEEFKIEPDHVVQMKFNDFVIGNTHDKEVEKNYESDSIKVGSYTDANGIKHDVFGTVTAKVNHFMRDVVSRGVLHVEVIDLHIDKSIDKRQFPGEFVWRTEWASFQGDSRALPNEIAKLTQKKPVPPPGPQDLFIMFTEPILDQTKSYLRNYYRKH